MIQLLIFVLEIPLIRNLIIEIKTINSESRKNEQKTLNLGETKTGQKLWFNPEPDGLVWLADLSSGLWVV